MNASPFEQKAAIPGIKNIIVVGSGKGGVGKSTVTINLAASLQKKGFKVGVLDADIYGPSVPRMLGALHQKPEIDENRKIIPIVRHGIKIMSMGFLVDENMAVVWRGPMLFKAIEQFFKDVAWGELDFLVIDLPPGTGDIALTIAQKVPVSGGITVSTPQNVALIDVKKAIDMFEKVGIPHLGLVENMSYLLLPGQNEKIALFPRGDLDTYLKARGILKLAQIPFNPQIGLGSEAGVPSVLSLPDSPDSLAFVQLADTVVAKCFEKQPSESRPLH